jgi:integrase
LHKPARPDANVVVARELARLIQTAEEGDDVLGMPGPERAMLYRLAVGTGFRAGELRSLTPESFDLDAEPPTVTVEAGYSKHRREDVQPIRRDLADLLRPWLAGKEHGKPVFKIPSKTAKMMREDLEAGRDAWLEEAPSKKVRKEREKTSFLKYRDAAGRVADFHALRHTYISRLVRSGANVKVAQELARHSTPTLTLGRYAHVQLVDQTRALDALPAIGCTKPSPEAVRATGTEDAASRA